MLKIFRSLYFTQRFFYLIAIFALSFLASHYFTAIYPYAWLAVLVFLFLILADTVLLFKENSLQAERILPEKFSNSDPNEVKIKLHNKYSVPLSLELIDEMPVQFQKRDFLKETEIKSRERKKINYFLIPKERGVYTFGKLNVYAISKLGLVKRRFTFCKNQDVKVYPSFIQMKKYDFLAIDNKISQIGLKKIRRIGHTMEFEQIKNYVLGDDIRTINWKATAKNNHLMVNQYQDEKSQPIYNIIDASRVMKMPFNGLKLLDYAINSSLAISNIVLKKHDKIGLLTFSHKLINFMSASSRKAQLQQILEYLYNINTKFLDADFGMLYAQIKRRINQRSLILLYTNFEHISGLKRQLPYLKMINRSHLLVVVFFENTEVSKITEQHSDQLGDIYEQTVATDFVTDKQLMVKELQKHGIQTILTKPEELTVNSINKYLEIKARGLI
ncbi:DUF58 domain-containing protein [Mesonia sp. K7]|uniref:DUF58 domain-containing protein n=1 Tax=Mesonia sp. K7 TaxID=2218606 RepID=UPI000DA918AD|nr:DUF58 domain-containing protein [Mesonia sp. K7]PZD77301.1 DUF58 domain-containing protein [Mesonia sp. K7]